MTKLRIIVTVLVLGIPLFSSVNALAAKFDSAAFNIPATDSDDDDSDVVRPGQISKARLNKICPCATGREDNFEAEKDFDNSDPSKKAVPGS